MGGKTVEVSGLWSGKCIVARNNHYKEHLFTPTRWGQEGRDYTWQCWGSTDRTWCLAHSNARWVMALPLGVGSIWGRWSGLYVLAAVPVCKEWVWTCVCGNWRLGKSGWCSEAAGELVKGRERRGQTGGFEVSCVMTGLGQQGGAGWPLPLRNTSVAGSAGHWDIWVWGVKSAVDLITEKWMWLLKRNLCSKEEQDGTSLAA